MNSTVEVKAAEADGETTGSNAGGDKTVPAAYVGQKPSLDKLATSFSRTMVHRNSIVIKDWIDASQMNYLSVRPLDVIASGNISFKITTLRLESIEHTC